MSRPAPLNPDTDPGYRDRHGNPIDLPAVLAAHRAWLDTDGREGTRANLTRANLAGADLTDAYLAGAYLAGAYLARANLTRANLTRAYLAGANLAGADLTGADLTDAYLARADLARADLAGAYLAGAKGCVLLTDTDHGYRVIAMMHGAEWRIYAGCRDFSIAEARAHWGAPDYHLPLSGRRVIACLDWLEQEIANGLVLGGAE